MTTRSIARHRTRPSLKAILGRVDWPETYSWLMFGVGLLLVPLAILR